MKSSLEQPKSKIFQLKTNLKKSRNIKNKTLQIKTRLIVPKLKYSQVPLSNQGLSAIAETSFLSK